MSVQETPPSPLRCRRVLAALAAAWFAGGPAWGGNMFDSPTPAERAAAGPLAGDAGTAAWNLATLEALSAEQRGETLDMAEAWRLVVLNDPDYQAALSARAAAETERRLGRAAILPQVQAGYSRSRITGSQRRYDQLGGSALFDLDYDSTSTYVQLQQPLFNIGRYAEYRRGQARARLGQAEFIEREQATAMRLAEVYLEALRAHNQWLLTTELAKSLKAQATAQERLFAANEGSRIDAQETRARLVLAQSDEIRARDARDVALRELESMIGRPAGALASLSAGFSPFALGHKTQAEWMAQARQTNPAVQAARERVHIAETELRRATGRYFPSLELVAGYSKADSENLSSLSQRSNTWTVGVNASIPLFSGGYDTANRARAAAELEQAKQELRAAEEAAEALAAREYTATMGGEARIQALTSAVSSAEQGLEAAKTAYQYGMRSNIDVLRSQDRLYQARSELVNARLAYLLAVANLHAATARLTSETFADISRNHLSER